MEQGFVPRNDTNFAPIDLFKKVSGDKILFFVPLDDLIPLQDRLAIKKRYIKFDPLGERIAYIEINELIMALFAMIGISSIKIDYYYLKFINARNQLIKHTLN